MPDTGDQKTLLPLDDSRADPLFLVDGIEANLMELTSETRAQC